MSGDATRTTPAVTDEHVAVAAHFLLGRLGVVGAVLARAEDLDDLDDATRAVLLDRSRAAVADIQAVLEDLARGLPPLLPSLLADAPRIIRDADD